MDGFNVLWLPGTDHAGIADPDTSWSGSSRPRARPGTTSAARRSSQRVWEWKEESGGTIIRQLKRLGASCDWERERFTMDEGLSRGRARGLRAPLRGGPDLPGRVHRQLVPALPDGALRPRGGARGARRRVRLHQVRAADRSAPCGRRPCSATPRSPSTRRTSATRSTWARRSRSRRCEGTIRIRWSPTARSTRSSAPAPSRSRPATTQRTSRSGGATACRSGRSSASTGR